MARATLSRISRFFSRRRSVNDIEHDISSMIIDQVINKKMNIADLERMKALVKELPAHTKYDMPAKLFQDLDGPGEKEMARKLITVVNHHIPKHGGRSKKKVSCGCRRNHCTCNSRRTRMRHHRRARTLKR